MNQEIRAISKIGYSRIITLPKDWVGQCEKVLIKRSFDNIEQKEVLKLIAISGGKDV